MHIGNRVGHAQGGVTFGLAARPRARRSRPNWASSAASAWYIGPARQAPAREIAIVHQGSSPPSCIPASRNDEKRGVLECVTSHARKWCQTPIK
jgi:hypothetical protein